MIIKHNKPHMGTGCPTHTPPPGGPGGSHTSPPGGGGHGARGWQQWRRDALKERNGSNGSFLSGPEPNREW